MDEIQLSRNYFRQRPYIYIFIDWAIRWNARGSWVESVWWQSRLTLKVRPRPILAQHLITRHSSKSPAAWRWEGYDTDNHFQSSHLLQLHSRSAQTSLKEINDKKDKHFMNLEVVKWLITTNNLNSATCSSKFIYLCTLKFSNVETQKVN